jgi:transposase-like protein
MEHHHQGHHDPHHMQVHQGMAHHHHAAVPTNHELLAGNIMLDHSHGHHGQPMMADLAAYTNQQQQQMQQHQQPQVMTQDDGSGKPKKARGKRTEYKSVTIEKKLELIKLFKEAGGRNVRSFANANGINEQTFYNWVHKYDKGSFPSSPNPKRKRARESNYPTVEAELLRFIETHETMSKAAGAGDKPAGISWLTLQTKASEIAQGVLGPEQRAAFKSSSGWIRNLIRRNNLGQRMNPDSSAPALTDVQMAMIASGQLHPHQMGMDVSHNLVHGHTGLEGAADSSMFLPGMTGIVGVTDSQLNQMFLPSIPVDPNSHGVPSLVYSESSL